MHWIYDIKGRSLTQKFCIHFYYWDFSNFNGIKKNYRALAESDAREDQKLVIIFEWPSRAIIKKYRVGQKKEQI